MAAPKENLLSLGQLTGTERNTFMKQRDHGVKNSYIVNRPVLLQADLSGFQSHQHFRVTQLQQYWHELKERELRAQQHNRELLQQFEKAQDTLKEMLARNATMKTTRMEYEQYLEERSPHWQQQLKEKTQLAQRTRMEDCLRSCIKIMGEERVTKSSEDRHSCSQGKKTQEVATTQEQNSQNIHSDYNQDGSSYLPYIQSSWLTHPQSQTARFPMRVSCQPQCSSHTPRSFLPHPHPFMLHHLASTPSQYHPWPRQDPPGWSSLQTDFWTAGAAGLPSGSEALWGQLYTEEPPPESRVSQVVAQDIETSRAPTSKSERGGGSRSSRLSQELDIKPVRLSSGHAESSESGRDSSKVIREKRKKKERRGRLQCPSHESSRTSSAIIIASVPSCESEASSGKCSTGGSKKRRWRSGGRIAQSPRAEYVVKERTRSKEDDSGSQKETSQCASGESGNQREESTSEIAGNQSADDKSEKCTEELGSISLQLKNGAGDEKEEQESSSSEQSSAEEKDVEEKGHEKHLGSGDNNAEEKENSQKDDKQEQGVEENDDSEEKDNSLREEKQEEKDEEEDVFARKETTQEEEETGAEEEVEEQECEDKDDLKNENCEKRSSASSQDEEVEDGRGQEEDKTEEDEEESAEEEQRSDKAGEPEEESNSEDSIISPQENRTHIPEEAAEDDNEKGSKTESSDGDDSNEFSEEDDIENLLAPQEQTEKKEEKDMKAAEKPKALCDKMKIFQVEDDRSPKTDHQSDSDEFDHFYD